MKPLHALIIGTVLSSQLHGMDSAQLTAVSKKFADKSTDVQYQARLELNKLVDEATAPGEDKRAEVNALLLTALASAETPHEAKKYILRVLSKTGTEAEVSALASLLTGKDSLFKEEARRALELIPGPASVKALESALQASKDPTEQIGLVNSLAIHRAESSTTLIQGLVLSPNAELARAAVNALGRIGTAEAITVLNKAYASSKVGAPTKTNLERAMLYAASSDPKTAALVFKSTRSDAIRLAAFRAMTTGSLDAEKTAALEAGVKSENAAIRKAALRQGIRSNLPSLQQGLAQAIDQLSPEDRLTVLANIHFLKSKDTAEKIAVSCLSAEGEAERIAALTALGEIASGPAFEAVLNAVGAKEPRINRAAGSILSKMDYPEGETVLLAMLKGDQGEQQILAIKAVSHRKVPEVNAILIAIVKGDNKAATGEAVKALYATASLQDLNDLCDLAKSTENEGKRRMITSVCTKIADRIDSDEARALVAPLK